MDNSQLSIDLEKAKELTPEDEKKVKWIYLFVSLIIIAFIMYWLINPDKAIDIITSIIGVLALIVVIIVGIIYMTLVPRALLPRTTSYVTQEVENSGKERRYNKFINKQSKNDHVRANQFRKCDNCGYQQVWKPDEQIWHCFHCTAQNKPANSIYCQKCGNSNLKVYDDGSGFCQDCNDTFAKK
jgi:ribosomal protein L37AE/L43A